MSASNWELTLKTLQPYAYILEAIQAWVVVRAFAGIPGIEPGNPRLCDGFFRIVTVLGTISYDQNVNIVFYMIDTILRRNKDCKTFDESWYGFIS